MSYFILTLANTFSKFIVGYWRWLIAMLVLSFVSSGLSLIIPRLVGSTVDQYVRGAFNPGQTLLEFALITIALFVVPVIQSIVSNYAAEKAGKQLRNELANRIAIQSYSFVNTVTPGKLLTNFTSDVEAVKSVIAQGVVSIASALILLIGSAVLLLSINWQLALASLSILPIIVVTFWVIFGRVFKYFTLAQENIDQANLVINENIQASALIRVLNATGFETAKYSLVTVSGQEIGIKILNAFASLIPLITFVANLGVLIIIWIGGNAVINNQLTLGELTAFYSYLSILITPIFIIGFISSAVGRASTSYNRIAEVLSAEQPKEFGEVTTPIIGKIELKNVTYKVGEKVILNNINISIEPGKRTAIIGPTAAGKTQLFYLIAGLISPTEGEVLIDGQPIHSYQQDHIYKQLGLVFQDSLIFNTTIKENISFESKVDDKELAKAIETSALANFIEELPNGLDTVITERGTNLSGGQRQRITLARALALDPKILLLDDFTARVDVKTESQILAALAKNYQDQTVVMITQKIKPVTDFDQIVLIMDGEVIESGTHEHLMEKSFEYQQIYSSQQSTES